MTLDTILLGLAAIFSAVAALLEVLAFRRTGREKEQALPAAPPEPEESQADRELLEGIFNLLSYQVGERKEEG